MHCPACGHAVLPGDEVCDKCQQSLTHLHKQQPRSNLERSIIKDRLRILSPKAPLAVTPDTPVGDVLKLLVERGIGCVLVVEGGQLAGIFSERDAVSRLNVMIGELASRPVSEFMTTKVETLDLDDKIARALHKMDVGGFRHVPVMSDGAVRGVISARDILRYMTDTILTAD